MKRSLLVTIEGHADPDITSEIKRVAAQDEVKLLDSGQKVTDGNFQLSLLLEMPVKHTLSCDLEDFCIKRGLQRSTQIIETENQANEKAERYILVCATPRTITASFISEVRDFLVRADFQIKRIENHTPNKLRSLELIVTSKGHFHSQEFKLGLMGISNKHHIDLALINHDHFQKEKKLIIFDMDSTLIEAEVIDEMASVHGVGDQVKRITERAMNGELNFDQSLQERVTLLKGLERKKIESIYHKISFTPGTERFMKTVKALGYKTAIISGGFQFFADQFKERLSMDYAFANALDWEGDVLSGKVKHPILNAQKKADLLEELARKENISLEQVVAIGDGANDLPMLAKAGLGVAFHAKEKVRLEARYHMGHGPMTTILYFLGIPGNHFDEAL